MAGLAIREWLGEVVAVQPGPNGRHRLRVRTTYMGQAESQVFLTNEVRDIGMSLDELQSLVDEARERLMDARSTTIDGVVQAMEEDGYVQTPEQATALRRKLEEDR
jgi:hypothetical protein